MPLRAPTLAPRRAVLKQIQDAEPDVSVGTLLVVDDEDAVRTLVARLLERSGYRVLQARNGNEALELVAAEPYDVDLLVTDLSMPGLGGQDLASRLEHLPVLFISGNAKDLPLRDRGTAFIQKPFSAADLTSAVDRLLTQRPLRELRAV